MVRGRRQAVLTGGWRVSALPRTDCLGGTTLSAGPQPLPGTTWQPISKDTWLHGSVAMRQSDVANWHFVAHTGTIATGLAARRSLANSAFPGGAWERENGRAALYLVEMP